MICRGFGKLLWASMLFGGLLWWEAFYTPYWGNNMDDYKPVVLSDAIMERRRQAQAEKLKEKGGASTSLLDTLFRKRRETEEGVQSVLDVDK